MNVKEGDLARIVGTGTVNDGAVVRVLSRDEYMEQFFHEPCWFVSGEKLLSYVGGQKFPSVIDNNSSCRDGCLKRIDPDEPAKDEREPVVIDEPVSPTENLCPTT